MSGTIFLWVIIKEKIWYVNVEYQTLASDCGGRESRSSTINGGDVDCVCVWIHKIYSSGSSQLSGASECIQTINSPLFSRFLCHQSQQEKFSSLNYINVLKREDLKVYTFITLWFGWINCLTQGEYDADFSICFY